MSQVNLNSVCFYKGDSAHRPIETELPLEGIDRLFPKLIFPSKGVTFLYGHRNPALPYLLRIASVGGQDAAIIDIHVEIGKWLRQKVDFGDDPDSGISQTRFLSISRAKKPVLDMFDGHWQKRMKEDGVAFDDWPKGPTKYPQYLDEIVALPEFKHLAVIAYSVTTPEVGSFQVATVFDKESIVLYDGGHLLQNVQMVI